MPITSFTTASHTVAAMSADSTTTAAVTDTVYNNFEAAAEVAKASSSANGMSASAYASAAPTQIFDQVTNLYNNYPHLRNGEYAPLSDMSLALKCIIGVFAVGGMGTALYRLIPMADVPPGEDPTTWKRKLAYAKHFLNHAAHENEQFRGDMAQAHQEVEQARQMMDDAAKMSLRAMRVDRAKDKYIKELELQYSTWEYEVLIWRDEYNRLQNEVDKHADQTQRWNESEAEAARLRAVNSQLENEKMDAEMDYDIKYVEMEAKLKNEKNEVAVQLSTAHEDLNTLRNQLSGVRKERDRLAKAFKESNESNGLVIGLREQLHLKAEKEQELRDSVQRAESNANELFARLQALQTELDTMKQQHALKHQDTIMRDAEMSGELEEAHQHADKLHNMLEQQNAITEEKDAALKQKDVAIQEAQTDIMELERINAEQKDLEKQYEDEIADSKQDDEELTTKLTTTEAECDEERKKCKSLEKKIEALTEMVATTTAERDEERNQREDLEAEIQQRDSMNNAVLAERNEERKKSKALEEEVAKLKAELSAPTASPQQSHHHQDSRRSTQRASSPSERSFKGSSSGSMEKLQLSVSASYAHKPPLLDVPPSALPSLFQAANGQETTVEDGDPLSSQHQEQASRSPASSFLGQATQQDPLPPATPIISASQDQLASSPLSDVSNDTPSKKRPRATESGPEAGPVSDNDESRVKRPRKIASPHKRDSPPVIKDADSMEDVAPSISSSQLPTLDLTNAPTFARPDVPVPATPASPTRRSRLPRAATVSPSRKSTRTTKKEINYNEVVMARAASPSKDTEMPAPAPAVAASSQQSEVRGRARAKSPVKKGAVKEGAKSPKKTVVSRKR